MLFPASVHVGFKVEKLNWNPSRIYNIYSSVMNGSRGVAGLQTATADSVTKCGGFTSKETVRQGASSGSLD